MRVPAGVSLSSSVQRCTRSANMPRPMAVLCSCKTDRTSPSSPEEQKQELHKLNGGKLRADERPITNIKMAKFKHAKIYKVFHRQISYCFRALTLVLIGQIKIHI